jgi:deoxycytidylate deaminase
MNNGLYHGRFTMTNRQFTSLARIAYRHFFMPTVKKSKHFSFILRKGKVLVWGYNRRKQITGDGTYTVHAEEHAVSRLLAELRNKERVGQKHIMVNIRMTRDGHLRYAYPCWRCQQAMKVVGIRTVYYSLDHGGFGCLTQERKEV